MLSKDRKMTRVDYLRELPPIESPITVRLKFIKVGDLQYISHLDLQRSFNRIIVRSGLPVWYSKGFNPHIKLVFSTPLSVGTQSECEFLDLRLDRKMDCDKVMELLNAEMTEQMHVTEAYIPTTKFSDIAFCEYDYEISCKECSAELAQRLDGLFSSDSLRMVKRTKSGEKEIDILPLIASHSTSYDTVSKTVKMRAVLNASTENFLNPEMLVSAAKDKLGILSGDVSKEWYTITRKRSLTSSMEDFR